jgi:hypothetical protein
MLTRSYNTGTGEFGLDTNPKRQRGNELHKTKNLSGSSLAGASGRYIQVFLCPTEQQELGFSLRMSSPFDTQNPLPGLLLRENGKSR